MVWNGLMLHFRGYGDLDNVPFSRLSEIIAALLDESAYVYQSQLRVKSWSEFASARQKKYGLTDAQVRTELGVMYQRDDEPISAYLDRVERLAAQGTNISSELLYEHVRRTMNDNYQQQLNAATVTAEVMGQEALFTNYQRLKTWLESYEKREKLQRRQPHRYHKGRESHERSNDQNDRSSNDRNDRNSNDRNDCSSNDHSDRGGNDRQDRGDRERNNDRTDRSDRFGKGPCRDWSKHGDSPKRYWEDGPRWGN